MNFYDELRDEQRVIAEKLKNAFNQKKERESQLVVQHFEKEHRISTEIRDRFLDNIDGLLDLETDVLEALESEIEEDMLLKAEEIKDADVPNNLARIVPVRDIIDYHLGSGRDQSPAEEYLEEDLIEDIQSGDISPRKLRGKLRGKREIVWCTFAKAIDDEWQRSNSPDQIRDMLGLWGEKYYGCSYIVEFRYSKAKVDVLRFPTVKIS